MNTKVFGTLALLVSFLTACSDLPSESHGLVAFEPAFAASDPPPPPADGNEVPFEDCSGAAGVTVTAAGCPSGGGPGAGSFLQILSLNAKYFRAPGSGNVSVTFSSPDPDVQIHNARARDDGTGVVGKGTITAWVFLNSGDVLPTRIIVDLTTATGDLQLHFSNVRHFFFTARAFIADTNVPVPTDVLFWFSL